MSFFALSQEKLKGVWQHEKNKDDLIIIYVREDNVRFYNYRLDQPFNINEKVISVDGDHVHTSYYDILNDYGFEIYYNLLNSNTLIRGSEKLNIETTYKRIN
ncbi:unnamed protein product [marine sediment metagenome]|uniref:Uncharacterized protein n=1 Tax=marine sediment metagenome TaxID=412755 RepID=X1AG25_9ZZZZ